ncbi:MAG: hypothetical protein VYA30_07830 [Myxococcota bacterium]|nr:hypothetical protein [Myxococcota bacterium]
MVPIRAGFQPPYEVFEGCGAKSETKTGGMQYRDDMRYVLALISICFVACVSGDLPSGLDGGLGQGPGGGADQECSPGSRKCVVGQNKTQLCNDRGQWTVPRNCISGVCQDGICTRSCESACTPGETQCRPSGLQTCERGQGECGVWGETQPCPVGEVCQPGRVRCEPGRCSDQCDEGTVRCTGDAAFSRCVLDGQCTRWSDTEVCPAGQVCSGGQCQGAGQACRDSCSENSVVCLDDSSFQQCSRQANSCLDYNSPQNCPDGLRCNRANGQCENPCPSPPECQLVRERCFQGGIQICVPNQFNGCPTWGAIQPCGPGQVCDGQQLGCVQGCEPECNPGSRRCVNDGYQVCSDAQGCAAWGPVERCPGGQQCRGDGECANACRDGETETRECGQCGVERRDCRNGDWGIWLACEERGACQPGDVQACGNCGLRFCGDDCQWEPCRNDGVCAPGDEQPCGECGVQVCNMDCEWNGCGNSNGARRDCGQCGWQWCLPGGTWSDDCEGYTDDPCQEGGLFGYCSEDGFCIYEV